MPVLITPGAFTRSSSFARLADRPDGLVRDVWRLIRTDPVSACKLALLCMTTLPARSPRFSPPRGLYTAAADSDTLAESRAHRADESLLTLLQLLIGSRAPLEPATVPTFVVGGSLDTLVPPATARRVADRLEADYVELDVAHNFSEEPAGVVVEQAVEHWLDDRGLLGRPTPVS